MRTIYRRHLAVYQLILKLTASILDMNRYANGLFRAYVTELLERTQPEPGLERGPSPQPPDNDCATLQYALCLAVAGSADEAQRILAPALRTSAALGLNRLLIDEGPQMLRLAKNTVAP